MGTEYIIKLNNKILVPFKVNKGLKQGCSLSFYYTSYIQKALR